MRDIRLGQRETHDIRADDHGQTRFFEEAGENQGERESHDGDGQPVAEEFEQETDSARREKTHDGCEEPDPDCLEGQKADVYPVDAGGARAGRGGEDTQDDGEPDDAQDVVDHGTGQNRDPFG